MRSRDEEQGWPSRDRVNKGEGAGIKEKALGAGMSYSCSKNER